MRIFAWSFYNQKQQMNTIEKPTLLVDKTKALSNLEMMSLKAKQAGVLFRPHFKTHQSAEIGAWFREFGVKAITVSSVDMAIYFAENGWNDITIAFPVNIPQWKDIDNLATKINLNILVENLDSVEFLDKTLNNCVGVFIEIDTGYPRTGIVAENFETIKELADRIEKSKNLAFKGFLTHAGHTYKAKNRDEIIEIAQTAMKKMLDLKQFFKPHFPNLQLSWGDTPSCSLLSDFSGFDEIRPGNFVYYDEVQASLGSCSPENIAVAVACPVVAVHPERKELVIYGGAVHLSKDYVLINDTPHYGRVIEYKSYIENKPKTIGYISSLSQEHGIIRIDDPEIKIKIGDVVIVSPVHSCLTADLLKSFHVRT